MQYGNIIPNFHLIREWQLYTNKHACCAGGGRYSTRQEEFYKKGNERTLILILCLLQ